MTDKQFDEFLKTLDDDTDRKYALEAWDSMTASEKAACTEEQMEGYIEDTYKAVEEQRYRDVPNDKYMIAVLDDGYYEEHNEYPEDFDSDFSYKGYVFDTPEEFVAKWHDLPEGGWYWCFDKGELFCSGAIDPGDIEIFEDHFDMEFDVPNEEELLDISSMSKEDVLSSVIDLENKLENMYESEIDDLVYEYIKHFPETFTKIEETVFEMLPKAIEKYQIGPDEIDGEANENCFYNCDAVYMEAICEVLEDVVEPVECGCGKITLKEKLADEVDANNSVVFRVIRAYIEDINLGDYDLGGVEITEDDYNTIYERLTEGYSARGIGEIVDAYLNEIREVLDEGLDEVDVVLDDDIDLPDCVIITASVLALDTDDMYEDKEYLSDIVSDYLSDNYGFCHKGFDMEVRYNELGEPSEVVATDIQWDVDIELDDDIEFPDCVIMTPAELELEAKDMCTDKLFLENVVSDFLSCNYGLCRGGFGVEVRYNEDGVPSEIVATDIQWDACVVEKSAIDSVDELIGDAKSRTDDSAIEQIHDDLEMK